MFYFWLGFAIFCVGFAAPYEIGSFAECMFGKSDYNETVVPTTVQQGSGVVATSFAFLHKKADQDFISLIGVILSVSY